MAITALDRREGQVPDGTIPPALSGADDSPKVLDNLKLWVAIAIVLVILAYTLPLASIIERGGLFGPGFIRGWL